MTALDWLTYTLGVRTMDCILWPFGVSSGYGRVNIDGRNTLAHVVACEHVNGPKPEAHLEAAHLCHQPLCVNGRHLYWATPLENAADRIVDGTRQPFTRYVPRLGKLDAVAIADLRARYLAGRVSQQQLAAEYGVAQATVSRYLHGYKASVNHAE
jgi:hypothetical protein